jgi:hypothetical protein
VRVRGLRGELDEYTAELRGSRLVASGVEAAMTYLPVDQVADMTPPTAYVMLFENNGFGGGSLALDLLVLRDRGTEQNRRYIGHEFHHGFLGRVDRTLWPEPDDDSRRVIGALSALHGEGVASMIDKVSYLDPAARARLSGQDRETAQAFAEFYEDSPNVLARVDSMLAGIHQGSLEGAATGREIRQMLPWGGHRNGMYLASSIERAFGRDRLARVTDPFSFLFLYDDVADTLGVGFRFSPMTLEYIHSLQSRYVR